MSEGNGVHAPYITPQSDKPSQSAPAERPVSINGKTLCSSWPSLQNSQGRGSVLQRLMEHHPRPETLRDSTAPFWAEHQPIWPSTLASHPPHRRPGWGKNEGPVSSSLPQVAAWQPLSCVCRDCGISMRSHALPHKRLTGPRPHPLGHNQTQPKGLSLTSLVHLVWFPLLKKRPFSQFSLRFKHSFFPLARRLLHDLMLYTIAEHICHRHDSISVKQNGIQIRALAPSGWATLGTFPTF